MFPYFIMGPPPNKGKTTPKQMSLKDFEKFQKELEAYLADQDKKKKEKDKSRKPATYSPLQVFALLVFFSPFVGILWIVGLYQLQGLLTSVLQSLPK